MNNGDAQLEPCNKTLLIYLQPKWLKIMGFFMIIMMVTLVFILYQIDDYVTTRVDTLRRVDIALGNVGKAMELIASRI